MTATKVKTETVNYTLDKYVLDEKETSTFVHNAFWVNATIELDQNEMKNRIIESNKKVRDTAAWSTEFNNGVRKGIRDAGTEHLVRNYDRAHVIGIALLGLMNSALATVGSEDMTSIAKLLAYGGVYCTVMNLFPKKGHGYRLSLIAGIEHDRALVLQAASRVVKVISQK